MDRGEVTPTLKLRRRVVFEHFSDAVESLYDGSSPPESQHGDMATR
jgi:hypothetical protein